MLAGVGAVEIGFKGEFQIFKLLMMLHIGSMCPVLLTQAQTYKGVGVEASGKIMIMFQREWA